MRIMVFDVPAVSGGALSVLNDFYNEYKNDEINNYIFVISKPELKETKNIKVLRFPWIKKSWIHRIYFDYLIAPMLVRKYEVDEIFSLQNVIVPNANKYQTVYVHNSLPFSEYRFSFKENRLLWIYQNIISKSIFKSITKADRVIVQTNWMKSECIKKLNVDGTKLEVNPPQIQINNVNMFDDKFKDIVTFFYPASGVAFKNHKIIVEACIKLRKVSSAPFKVIFTLSGNENDSIIEMYRIVSEMNLPIEFIGTISRVEVFCYYSSSILLFPSYVESSPLPLTEARIHNTPILASDYAFSHEILDGYVRADFFNAFDAEDLMKKMKTYIHKYADRKRIDSNFSE